MNNEVKRIHTPLDDEVIKSLKPGDMVLLSGKIYCGRDAVLPKVCKLIKENKLGDTDINLMGNVIFHNSVYAVIPPVTALLGENTLSRKVIAFSELGMEALYELEIRDYPIIIAAAHGESIY